MATGHRTASTGARFATRSVTFTTRHGDLDVVLLPDGTKGYEQIIATATSEVLPGTAIVVPVASAEMILQSKYAAGRPKDNAVLDRMREALEAAEDSHGEGTERGELVIYRLARANLLSR